MSALTRYFAAPAALRAPPRRAAAGRGYWLAHLASLAAAGLILLKLDHWMWFWFDDWDFVQDRGLAHSRLGLLAPHNDHWSTLPILAYRALLSVFGLGSYLPFLILLAAAHLALTHVLWRMSLRAGARPLPATALAGVFAVLGGGVQNLVWGFQIGFVGSVLAGWLWLWVTDHDGGKSGRNRDAAGWALGLAALMCSGIGVPMLMVTAVAVALRRGIRAAALVTSVPAAAFAVWYLVYGRLAVRSAPISAGTLLRVGGYAFTGIEHAFSAAAGFPGAGAVLAAALLYGLLRRDRAAVAAAGGPSDATATAGAAGVLLTFLFIGIGRSGLGAAESDRSRYVYIVIALVLPAAALLLSGLLRPGPGPAAALGLVLAVVLAVNVSNLVTGAHRAVGRSLDGKQQILAAYDVANGSGYVFPDGQAAGYTGPQPSVAGLRQFRLSGWLGPPRYRVYPRYLLGARARLQVGVLPPGAVAPPAAPAVVARARNLTLAPAGPGCAVATPDGPDAFLGLAPARQALLLTLTRQAPGTLFGHLRTAHVRPSGAITPVPLPAGPTRLLMAATGLTARLYLPPGPTLVCGLLATG